MPYWLSYTHRRDQRCGTQYGDTFYYYDWPPSFIDDKNSDLNTSYAFSSWMNLLIRARNLTVADLMDSERLTDNSKVVYRNLFPYLFQQQYVALSNNTSDGVFTRLENRLLSKDSSVRVMQVALIVLCVIVVSLHFLRPRTYLDHNPASLASLARMLSTNPNFAQRFSKTGTMTEQELSCYLEKTAFHTDVQADDRLIINISGEVTDSSILDSAIVACRNQTHPTHIPQLCNCGF